MPTRKWRAESRVNTTTAGEQVFSDVAALAGGGYVVVWQDSGSSPSSIRAQRFDEAGTKVGAEIEIGATIPDAHTQPSVTGLADGSFYVTFTHAMGAVNRIEGEVCGADGSFIRYQPVIFPLGFDEDSDVSSSVNGSVAVWRDPEGDLDLVNDPIHSSDVQIRFFDNAGVGGGISLVNLANISISGDQDDFVPKVAASQNDTVVVWRRSDLGSSGDVYATTYNNSGGLIAQEFRLNATLTDIQDEPVVAWIADGVFAVAWTDFSSTAPGYVIDIRCRLFSRFGTALTGEILVNGTIAGAQVTPAIAALPSGGFVIAWSDSSPAGGDTSSFGIKLQAFDGAGTKLGGEILVNTTTAGSQTSVALSTLADGRVVVTWSDVSSGNADIRQQIVDPRDGIVSGTGNADLLYGHDNVADEISGNAGADTLYGLKGDDSIYGGEGGDIADGGGGNDTLFGGADNDTLLGGLGDDELNGEDGNDTLRGGAGADAIDGGVGTADMADYLTVTSGGVTAALDASLAGTGEALGDTFAGIERLRGTNFDDTLRGDAGANLIFGQNGADVLDGRAGADRMIGGLGIDTLTGGTQADRFEFAALTEIGDIITDFTAVDDTIVITGGAFGGGLVAGTLNALFFQSRADNVAQDADDRFILRTTDKTLWFDADGNGAGTTVMVADLQASATMTNVDILVV